MNVIRSTMAYKIQSNIAFGFAWLLVIVHVSYSLNLGLISGDLKRTSGPLIIKKTHNSPMTINIKSGTTKLPTIMPPVLTTKYAKKPSLIKAKKKSLLKSRLRKSPKLPKLRKLQRTPKLPLLPIPPILPLIPKLPLLPLLPLLPPFPLIPPLPLLPPLLPILPKIVKPIRMPIVGKTRLSALGSEITPVKVPSPDLKRHILEKLVKLRSDGSLTASEFIRFKKLLL